MARLKDTPINVKLQITLVKEERILSLTCSGLEEVEEILNRIRYVFYSVAGGRAEDFETRLLAIL